MPAREFLSKEAQYYRFNFQRTPDVDDLKAILHLPSRRSPPVILLGGDLGSGRRYLLSSAIFQAGVSNERDSACLIRYSAIDLEGHEPGGSKSVENYVNVQLQKARDNAERTRLSQIFDKIKLTVSSPVLLSIGFKLDLSARELISFFTQTFEHIPLPKRNRRDDIHRIISALTVGKQKLVLHVLDSPEINDTLRGELVDEAQINAKLILAFSCKSHDLTGQVAPGVTAVRRFDLSPLALDELRTVVDHRFQPNTFPDEFYTAMLRYTNGYPNQLAVKMADLVYDDVVSDFPSGSCSWRLVDGIEGHSFAQEFGTEAYDPIRKALNLAPEPQKAHLRKVLHSSALCGAHVPVHRVLSACEIPSSEWDGLIDLIDGMCDPPLFKDFGYGHASFPDQLIYGFHDAVSRWAILGHVSEEEREQLALRLLLAFENTLPLNTRGISRLFLELTDYVCSSRDRDEYLQRLSWWIGFEEVNALSNLIEKGFREGRLKPDIILGQINRHLHSWLPYQARAVLEVIARHLEDLPVESHRGFHYSYSYVLLGVGEFVTALYQAQNGLRLARSERLVRIALYQVIGRAWMNLGKYRKAERCLWIVCSVRESEMGPDDPTTAQSFALLAEVYQRQGRYAKAEALFNRALATLKKMLGMDHPATGAVMIGLAWVYLILGRYADAEPLFQCALAISEKMLMPSYTENGSARTGLAWLYRKQQRYAEAKQQFERAFEFFERILGPEHPQTAAAMNSMAWVYSSDDRHTEAEVLCDRALGVLKKTVGPEHILTASAMGNLAGLYVKQGRYGEAEPLAQDALAAVRKTAGPEHPDTASATGNLAWVYARQRRYDEAEPLYQRVVAIREAALGLEHPDTLSAMASSHGYAEDRGATRRPSCSCNVASLLAKRCSVPTIRRPPP